MANDYKPGAPNYPGSAFRQAWVSTLIRLAGWPVGVLAGLLRALGSG